jgi:pSer/pThr/pTyr-binding forkhead associated (FHA) protein
LLVTAGPQEGAEFTLRLGTLQLGRTSSQADAPDIALQDRGVSRPHAELRRVGEGYSLADVGSVNGTWVNGQELTQATILQDGDVIQLGETTLLYRAAHRVPS